MHDTVEDTNVVTFERIEKEFGVTVRRIVEGETKVVDFETLSDFFHNILDLAYLILSVVQVSKLGKLKCKNEKSSVQDVKAHDLRQMFLAMTEEVIY